MARGFDWRAVWRRKGALDSDDLKLIDGYEHTTIEPATAAAQLAELMALAPDDSVLEVGCGAGMIARHLACRYVGLDYADTMAAKHRALLGNPVVQGEADRLPFADGAFDKVFAFSVFHYFPSAAYARRAVAEMRRVARRLILIGDLPERSHSEDHLLFRREDFAGWTLSEGLYNPLRFNAVLHRPAAGAGKRPVRQRRRLPGPATHPKFSP